jgi:hypothetical protein
MNMADIIGKGRKHSEDSPPHRTGSNTLISSSDQEIEGSLGKEPRKTPTPETKDKERYVRDILQFNQGFVSDE